MSIEPGDRDFGFICIAAVRYATGRRTYAASLVTEWIRAHAALIPAETLVVMRNDLTTEIERDARNPEYGLLGHDCDRTTWLRFHEWLCARSA